MKRSKIFAGVMGAFLSVVLCTVAVGQDKATAQEVVAKVREAASTLSKTGDVAQFNQKQSPWVWKTLISLSRTAIRRSWRLTPCIRS